MKFIRGNTINKVLLRRIDEVDSGEGREDEIHEHNDDDDDDVDDEHDAVTLVSTDTFETPD